MDYHQFDKFLVIITGTVTNTKAIDDVFQILWKNGLINSNILISNRPDFWTIYTFMPYRIDCSTLSYEKLVSLTPSNFTEMTLTMRELYPEKLINFNKCPLNVAIATLNPLVYRSNSSESGYTGIDINIIQQISELLNFSIVFKPSVEEHGNLYPNGSLTGAMGLVKIKAITYDNTYLSIKMINYRFILAIHCQFYDNFNIKKKDIIKDFYSSII